jgi:sugar O-acyltransferase (sialic acid O-acetyltransferase NeuD family)
MIVIGAKGFAKQLLPTLIKMNFSNLLFFDDLDKTTHELCHYPIIHDLEIAKTWLRKDNRFIIGVGTPSIRKKLCGVFEELGGKVTSAHNEFALISPLGTLIEDGVAILQSAIIESSVLIKKAALINIGAKICHDSFIGEFSEVGPNVTILGGCVIGAETSIGASVTVLPKVRIGDNVTIGAGAVVVNNMPDNCVATGIPARIIRQL